MRQILILLFVFSLYADDAFTVSLRTESSLQPVALQSEVNGELSRVFTWDINHSGFMTVSEGASAATIELHKDNSLVYATVRSAKVAKKSDSLPATRESMHRLSDWIVKTLFHEEGVACSKILYTVRHGDVAEVWECDWDGHSARQITHEGKLIVTPCYFPAASGKRPGAFIYVSYTQGQPKMYIASLTTGKGTRLSSLRGNQLMPASSPSRTSIAFISDAMGNPDLFLLPYDSNTAEAGRPRQIFASPGGTQGTPTFSPDSSQIAFVSNKDGAPRIFMMSVPPEGATLKSLNPKIISKQCRENTSPCWSPSGRFIAYSGMTKGTRQIWVYDTVEKREEQITTSEGHKENPSWAADSLHLVFNSQGELYVVDVHSKKPAKITSGAGDKRFPSWEIIRR